MGKRKEEDEVFLRKKKTEKKHDICRCKRDSLSSEFEIARETFEKTY